MDVLEESVGILMFDMKTWVSPLLAAGIAAYAASWLLLLARRRAAGRSALAAGCVIASALAVVNGLLAGEPPLGNMYHALAALAVCLPPLYLWLDRRAGLGWTAAYFAFPSLVAMIGALCMKSGANWQRAPALQSPWFVPHVLAYMLSYALAAVAFALLAARWGRRGFGRAVDAAAYASASHQILRLAFPFMTFGLLSGALWAEQAWGAYWSWDPKETWSLITWTCYLAYLHCRRAPGTERYADAAHTLAFVALLITFLLVNLLPRIGGGLHSYA